MPTTPSDIPERLVLEGVPRVGFYPSMRAAGESRCPEDLPFPSCLRACLEYLGENLGCRHAPPRGPSWGLGCAYAHLLGTSGLAFSLTWRPGWHEDNADMRHMVGGRDAAVRRAIESAGYAHERVEREQASEGEMRRLIFKSIARQRRPLIAFGVIGPPEGCLVTGYGEGGDVLIGWSFFQGMPEFAGDLAFEETGQFRKRDWYQNTQGLVIIGDKRPRPSQKAVDRSALEWALEVMRTPVTCDDRRNGLAAYVAWADALLCDDDFCEKGEDPLRRRHRIHDDAVGAVAEARWYGSLFLARVAGDNDRMAPELYAAASCFAEEHRLMWQVWELVGGIGSEQMHIKLSEPQVRRQIAPLILQARESDARAAEHIASALA